VWVDCEMTGLDISKDSIIEIAVIVTDGQLAHIYNGPELIIKKSQEELNQMNEWCTKFHTESGLVQKCLDSSITI
jgi:oligoribonuclease